MVLEEMSKIIKCLWTDNGYQVMAVAHISLWVCIRSAKNVLNNVTNMYVNWKPQTLLSVKYTIFTVYVHLPLHKIALLSPKASAVFVFIVSTTLCLTFFKTEINIRKTVNINSWIQPLLYISFTNYGYE